METYTLMEPTTNYDNQDEDQRTTSKYDENKTCPECGYTNTLPTYIFDETHPSKGDLFICPDCNTRIPKTQLN